MSPGFHTMPMDEYQADPAPRPSLSSGIAKILLHESPLKAWYAHPRLNKDYREDYDAKFDLGTCAHSVLLENDATKIVIVQADDWRTKIAKEKRQEARIAGKTALLERHYDAVRKMVDVALAFIEESEIAEDWHAAQSELTGVALETSGVWLRCRFDKITIHNSIIFDYKTTEDVSPYVFSRQIVRMGYHVQEAFYRRVARTLGVNDPRFIFLAQSVNEPYECTLHGCDPALQDISDAEVIMAISLWQQCLKTNEWPSYDKRIHWAMPTSYMMQEHEMRAQEEAA